jgi:hypothetical protein
MGFSSWPVSFLSDIAQPFSNDVFEQLASLDVGESLDEFDVPPDLFPPSRGPTNMAGLNLLMVGVVHFVGTSVGSWAVGKVCDEIFDAKIRPALVRLRMKLTKKERWQPTKERPLNFRFGVWYDVDKVYIDVRAEATSLTELEQLEGLVPQAHKSALPWIEHNGISKRVLTFHIRHGELGAYPTLSDSAER